MQGQTEISVVIDGVSEFEYWSYVVPRIGERVEITYEDVDGLHVVQDVTHSVFKDRRGDVLSYVTLNLERV